MRYTVKSASVSIEEGVSVPAGSFVSVLSNRLSASDFPGIPIAFAAADAVGVVVQPVLSSSFSAIDSVGILAIDLYNVTQHPKNVSSVEVSYVIPSE